MNNKILKVNENLSIGLKNGCVGTTVDVEFLIIDSYTYYLDDKNSHNTLKDFIKNALTNQVRDSLTEYSQITSSDIKVFVNWFNYFYKELKVDIKEDFDLIYNEMFENYFKEIVSKIEFNMFNIFNNKINIIKKTNYGNKLTTFNIDTLLLEDYTKLLSSKHSEFRTVLRVLHYMYCKHGEKIKSNEYKIIKEYIDLLRFLSNKKKVKVNQKNISVIHLNQILKESLEDSTIKHNKNQLTLSYSIELSHYKRV